MEHMVSVGWEEAEREQSQVRRCGEWGQRLGTVREGKGPYDLTGSG